MSDLVVRLSEAEIMAGVVIGAGRHLESLRESRKGVAGGPKCQWDADIDGALAEMAVCKAMGLYFDPGHCGSTDIALANVEVRHTGYQTGRLILRDRDDSAKPYVLVTGKVPEMTVRGWVYGHEGKREEYLDAPQGRPPAFFVPQEALHSITELPPF